jgi:hypothetical protein
MFLSQSLYKETRKPHVYESEWDDAVYRVRMAHLKQILPLQKKRAELESQENEARRQLDAHFPRSSNEYRAMRSKDRQGRIARFLLADEREKERMMTQFGWASRQVAPLKNEYLTNVSILS